MSGLEPLTPALWMLCSNQLSYIAKKTRDDINVESLCQYSQIFLNSLMCVLDEAKTLQKAEFTIQFAAAQPRILERFSCSTLAV